MIYEKIADRSLFQGISDDSIQCLNAMNSYEASFEPEELIANFGDPLDYIFVILEGLVKTNEYTIEGKEIVSSYYDHTEAFPFYLSFSGVNFFPYNVYCVKPARVLFLPKDLLLQ